MPSAVNPPQHTHTHTCSPLSAVWLLASGVSALSGGQNLSLHHAGHWRSVLVWEWVSDGIWASDRSQSPLFCPQYWFWHRSVKLTALGQGQRWSGTRHVFRFKGTELFTSHHYLLTRMSVQSLMMFPPWNTKGDALKKIEGFFSMKWKQIVNTGCEGTKQAH